MPALAPAQIPAVIISTRLPAATRYRERPFIPHVCAFALCECVKESGRERREDILDYSNRDMGMGTFPAEVPLKRNRFERTLTDDGDRVTVTPTITV